MAFGPQKNLFMMIYHRVKRFYTKQRVKKEKK